MSTSDASDPRKEGTGPRRRKLRIALILGALVLGTPLGIGLISRGGTATMAIEDIPTAPVMRGDLPVTVTQGGTLRAMESLDIKSEVEGNNPILEIVPEGTVITDEDVANKKVLVRLDSSGLEDKLASRKMSYEKEKANLTQARESLDIQKKQNESNKKAAELKVKFNRMELAKYAGDALAQQMLEQKETFDFGRLAGLATLEVRIIFQEGYADLARRKEKLKGPELSVQELLGKAYAEPPTDATVTLGGESRQEVRRLSADVQLAAQQLTQAEEDLVYTVELVKKGYETDSREATDRLKVEQRKVQHDSAIEALRLFIRYTLPKEAEQRKSDCEEALRELDRVIARANSELAQAEAKLASQTATFKLEEERLQKTQDMIKKSSIVATKPGIVVYASTSNPGRRRNNPIQEGASVRENETIINMPDLSTLAARVNIRETDIAKVQVGQPATITVEALPGKTFQGKVARKSPMASSEHRWLNPNTMVYETDVLLDGNGAGLDVGMSATAEILIANLKDCLYVPVQAVTTYKGNRVCWVQTDGGPELRTIETGHFTDKYVEVRSGLRDGEVVYLAPPEELEEGPADRTQEESDARKWAGRETKEAKPQGQDAAAPPQEAPAAEAQTPQGGDGDKVAGMTAAEIGKKMAAMSEEERRQFYSNLSDEDRQKLRRMRGGRGGARGRRPSGEGGGQGAGRRAGPGGA